MAARVLKRLKRGRKIKEVSHCPVSHCPGWDAIQEWKEFYKNFFGWSVDLSGLIIPPRKRGFNRLVIIAGGLKIENVYKKCTEFFSCSSGLTKGFEVNFYDNYFHHDRIAAQNAPYAIWVRDDMEADEKRRGLSAHNLSDMRISGITLLERLVLELKIFKETGKHPDISLNTLCSGSRDTSGDFVAAIGWKRKMEITWQGAGKALPILATREVIAA